MVRAMAVSTAMNASFFVLAIYLSALDSYHKPVGHAGNGYAAASDAAGVDADLVRTVRLTYADGTGTDMHNICAVFSSYDKVIWLLHLSKIDALILLTVQSDKRNSPAGAGQSNIQQQPYNNDRCKNNYKNKAFLIHSYILVQALALVNIVLGIRLSL